MRLFRSALVRDFGLEHPVVEAILEVENVLDGINLSAQNALRDSIMRRCSKRRYRFLSDVVGFWRRNRRAFSTGFFALRKTAWATPSAKACNK
jgi:hypothetical protein